VPFSDDAAPEWDDQAFTRRGGFGSEQPAMKHPSTRAVFGYWDDLRGERSAPERGDIEPGALRHVLQDTFVLENGPVGPVFRLAGTRICAMFGGELKGRPFVALWPDVQAQGDIRRLTATVMDEAAGAVAGFTAETARGHHLTLELLLLPLRHRGRTHARMMGTLSPSAAPIWLGQDEITALRLISVRMIWASGKSVNAEDEFAITPEKRRAGFVLHEGGRI
jgi:hypothetical protein